MSSLIRAIARGKPAMIDQYITASRKLRALENVSGMYSHFPEILDGFFEAHGASSPVLKVVYTTNRRTEVVELNGVNYIIYDRYLGQSFNMLNRIFLNSTDPDDIVMYSTKVLAEYLQLTGESDRSALLILLYTELKNKCESYKLDLDFELRKSITAAQEIFILLHESAHILLENSNALPNIRGDKKLDLEDSLGEMRMAVDSDGFKNRCKDAGDREFIGAPSFRMPSHSASRSLFLGQLGRLDDLLQHRPDLVEECICDDFASASILKSVRKDGPETQIVAVRAIGLAFTHQMVLRFLQALADDLNLKASNFGSIEMFSLELTLRQANFLAFLRNNPNSAMDDETFSAARAAIEADRERYIPILSALADFSQMLNDYLDQTGAACLVVGRLPAHLKRKLVDLFTVGDLDTGQEILFSLTAEITQYLHGD